MSKIHHIVYPYKLPDEPFGFELKYSIRSVFQHFKGNFDITIIGDIPDWVNRDEIICIPFNNDDIKAQRQTKINQKILKASELYDDFILFNDDQYLLQDITPEQLMLPRMWNKRLTFNNKESVFRRQTQNTINKLMDLNCHWKQNMVSHCPYYYNSLKVKELNNRINLVPFDTLSIVFEVAYFNYFEIKAFDAADYRIGFYNRVNKIDTSNYYILNHDNRGINTNPGLLELISKFNKCKGEK